MTLIHWIDGMRDGDGNQGKPKTEEETEVARKTGERAASGRNYVRVSRKERKRGSKDMRRSNRNNHWMEKKGRWKAISGREITPRSLDRWEKKKRATAMYVELEL